MTDGTGKKIELREGEQLDDLQCAGLRILQKRGAFRYGTDAVLLANYAAAHVNASASLRARLERPGAKLVNIADAGTGTGIVPILLCGKLGAVLGQLHVDAVEIQPDMCELAARSVALNGLDGIIDVRCADICRSGLENMSCDAVTLNPPYVRAGSGLKSDLDAIACAKHEIFRTQEEMIAASAALLRFRGQMFLVDRPDRLTDALAAMRGAGVEPAELTMVHADFDAPPVLFLCTGRKGGGKGLKVTAPRKADNYGGW